MPANTVEKVYDPKKVEDKWYRRWLEKGYCHAEVNPARKPYCIVIPPPNVTDVLHMGHAYNNTIQDVLIRFHRMQGYETLWMPGTDHAGIATQNVVEKDLWRREKVTRHQLGREKFVERVWQWRAKYGSTIIKQLQKLGCSCDWQRERFTLDEGLSKAVAEVFVRLYRKGLIYRGKYIVNWCPRCQTALSDEEAIHQDQEGNLWYIKYPLKGTGKFVTVATTRPETMLGDVAVAVHPYDPRFKKLIGKQVILPVMERPIPIIGDEQVMREFGTGAVKVTPAHDPNDFEIARRHHLTPVNVMNGDGTMNENAGKYQGHERFACRKALVEELQASGLLEKIEKHTHSIAHCQRCDTILEPFLSEQWFVKIKPLAEPALKVVQEGKIVFQPEKWVKVYTNWMENVRDWCISRQLWWGHRIPVYYCDDCGHTMVEVQAPPRCAQCQGSRVRQDEDVLDTWFSSWLWPFSTMGWPEPTPELRYFYPTNALVTAADIIFFWVARMIMAGLEFAGDIPFRHVYFNGIIRDAQGRKMSKSLGTGIDPLEMIEKFSADAVRFTLLMLTSEGQDINLAESHFELGRNFSNKVWNAFRFLSMNFDGKEGASFADWKTTTAHREQWELADRWILSRFNKTNQKITQSLENYKFNEAVEAIYSFSWHEYCDWYLELIKPRLMDKGKDERDLALKIAVHVMKGTMALLHPVAPFISEEIWSAFRLANEESLVIAPWPSADVTLFDDDSEKKMVLLQQIIGAVRNIRGEMNVPPHRRAEVLIKSTDHQEQEFILENQTYLESLALVDGLQVSADLQKPRQSASAVVGGLEIYVPLSGLIDIGVERARLEKEIGRIDRQLSDLNQKLSNQDFLRKAPPEVVEREKKKKEDFEANLKKLQVNLASLEE